MAIFPDRGGKSLENLFTKDWSRFFYYEPVETWDEKCRSLMIKWWRQISIFMEAGVRRISDYWYLSMTLIAVTIFVITIHKSIRYLATIEIRGKNNPEITNEEKTSNARSHEIVSDGNELDDDEAPRDDNLREPLSTFTPHQSITQGDCDRSSSISSEATIVPADLPYVHTDFLPFFVESIASNDETDRAYSSNIEDDRKSLDVQHQSTLRKVDSENFKKFYVLTSFMEPFERTANEEIEKSARDSTDPATDWETNKKSFMVDHDENITRSSLKIEEKSVQKITDFSVSTVHGSENNEAKSVEKITDFSARTICGSETSEEKSVTKMTDLSASPISRAEKNEEKPVEKMTDLSASVTWRPETREKKSVTKITDLSTLHEKSVCGRNDVAPSEIVISPILNLPIVTNEPEVLTDSEYRLESPDYENRGTSKAGGCFEIDGDGIVSPASTKNRQHPSKQSKIPAPSIQGTMVTDRGLISEAADQIRTALLRKFRDVWRSRLESQEFLSPTSSSKNWTSLKRSSIDSTLPDVVSKIPVARKSPRSRTSN